MGYPSVGYYCRDKLALPGVYHSLSQRRYLTHICIVRVSPTGPAWRLPFLVTEAVSHSHLHSPECPQLALPGVYHSLSQRRYLTHICIVRVSPTGPAWRLPFLVTEAVSHSHLHSQSVPSFQLSQKGVDFFWKFRHGTCLYQQQQQVKPLSVTDIFRQQSEMG